MELLPALSVKPIDNEVTPEASNDAPVCRTILPRNRAAIDIVDANLYGIRMRNNLCSILNDQRVPAHRWNRQDIYAIANLQNADTIQISDMAACTGVLKRRNRKSQYRQRSARRHHRRRTRHRPPVSGSCHHSSLPDRSNCPWLLHRTRHPRRQVLRIAPTSKRAGAPALPISIRPPLSQIVSGSRSSTSSTAASTSATLSMYVGSQVATKSMIAASRRIGSVTPAASKSADRFAHLVRRQLINCYAMPREPGVCECRRVLTGSIIEERLFLCDPPTVVVRSIEFIESYGWPEDSRAVPSGEIVRCVFVEIAEETLNRAEIACIVDTESHIQVVAKVDNRQAIASIVVDPISVAGYRK